MVAFLKRGRDISDPLNTTKVPMPPKGGNPALNDKQLADLVVFLRGLQDE
jgi:disulfide bond formation protein DsbB